MGRGTGSGRAKGRHVNHLAIWSVVIGALLSTGCSLSGGDLIVGVRGAIPERIGQSPSAKLCRLTAVSEGTLDPGQ